MQVVLVMFRGDGDGEDNRRSFSITRDVTVVGRREDCDFRIPLHEISRKHCRLIKDGSTLRVEDLGSSNGTYHNGVRIQSADLAPGDTLQVGSVAFVVQIDGTPVEEELSPMTASRRETRLPQEEAAQSDITLQDTPRRSGDNGTGNGNGEFDPMSVLEAEGSDAMPAPDDSHISDDSMIDLAGNSPAAGDAASDHV